MELRAAPIKRGHEGCLTVAAGDVMACNAGLFPKGLVWALSTGNQGEVAATVCELASAGMGELSSDHVGPR
jgi:hypothetical protein